MGALGTTVVVSAPKNEQLGVLQTIQDNSLLTRTQVQGKSELFCNHINGNKRDNKLENLEYCTHKENMAHAVKMDLCPKGANHYEAKITESQVRYIKTVFKNCEVEYGYWAKVARDLNVIPGTISAIVTNRSWKHIKV